MADIDVSKLSITEIDQITCFNNAGELEFIMDEIQEGTISNTQEKAILKVVVDVRFRL